jgi:hypothetical protein
VRPDSCERSGASKTRSSSTRRQQCSSATRTRRSSASRTSSARSASLRQPKPGTRRCERQRHDATGACTGCVRPRGTACTLVVEASSAPGWSRATDPTHAEPETPWLRIVRTGDFDHSGQTRCIRMGPTREASSLRAHRSGRSFETTCIGRPERTIHLHAGPLCTLLSRTCSLEPLAVAARLIFTMARRKRAASGAATTRVGEGPHTAWP